MLRAHMMAGIVAVVLGAGVPAFGQTVIQGIQGPTIVPSDLGLPPGAVITSVNGVPVGPSRPMIITQDRISGFNNQTGGWDTRNEQINSSRFDPYRDDSRWNGSRRWVQRPIRDRYGRITGYSEGWVWNNSITGREHGELNSFTPNELGGVHEGRQYYRSGR